MKSMMSSTRRLPGRTAGTLIAAVFGAVYVLVNSGALPSWLAWVLRVVVAVALVVVLISLFGPAARAAVTATGAHGPVFGRPFWVVVAVEVVALFGGIRLLAGPLGVPEAGVAWTSVVVGVHFFALAIVLHQPFFHVLGGIITTCGVVSLILAFTGAERPVIDVVGGILPGLTLLVFAGWGARRRGADTPSAVSA